MKKVFKNITRAVWILSLVSMFADIVSEMLYPIIPVYLQSIALMIASAFAGLLWTFYGASVTFLLTAIMSVLVLVFVLVFVRKPPIQVEHS